LTIERPDRSSDHNIHSLRLLITLPGSELAKERAGLAEYSNLQLPTSRKPDSEHWFCTYMYTCSSGIGILLNSVADNWW